MIIGNGVFNVVSTHSRPKAAGLSISIDDTFIPLFQHTAARRRLVIFWHGVLAVRLFQHTAARRRLGFRQCLPVNLYRFQHTAARRRLVPMPL